VLHKEQAVWDYTLAGRAALFCLLNEGLINPSKVGVAQAHALNTRLPLHTLLSAKPSRLCCDPNLVDTVVSLCPIP